MTSFTTFYLSRALNRRVRENGQNGIIKDFLIRYSDSANALISPQVIGVKLQHQKKTEIVSFEGFRIEKRDGRLTFSCPQVKPLDKELLSQGIFLKETILDKQIVDLNGRKLVRVNDVRMVTLANGTFVVAVDIGIEGLMRRIGFVVPLKKMLAVFNTALPSKFILWEDVEALDFSNFNIRLSKTSTKLHTLHPSDLADIIEDMGKDTGTRVFSSLDEEKAADVLEEMEVHTQVHIVESLPLEKAADVLEKMPADEVADILDALETDKAESLLREMEKDSSEEVRELLEYPDHAAGSIMTTDILTFKSSHKVCEVLAELRLRKPESEMLYSLFVTDNKDKLKATFSLRDIVISDPEAELSEIMKPATAVLFDTQEIDDVAEIVSKYNLLAIPVIDRQQTLQGMVVIDDVIEDLMNKRRTNK